MLVVVVVEFTDARKEGAGCVPGGGSGDCRESFVGCFVANVVDTMLGAMQEHVDNKVLQVAVVLWESLVHWGDCCATPTN